MAAPPDGRSRTHPNDLQDPSKMTNPEPHDEGQHPSTAAAVDGLPGQLDGIGRSGAAPEADAADGDAGPEPSVDGADAPAGPEHDELPVGHEATREELAQRLEQAESALAIVEAERDEYRSDLQRKAAELSNVLKREERNAASGRIEGRIEVIRSLLEVLDDFDRAMEVVSQLEDEGVRAGVGLVHDKMRAALASHGLSRVGEVGEAFDPGAKHEAVHKIDAADGPLDEPVVTEVYRPGYVVGDRVVRAAMVVVEQ